MGLYPPKWGGVDGPATLEWPQKQDSLSHLPPKVWIVPTPGQVEPSMHIQFRFIVRLKFFFHFEIISVVHTSFKNSTKNPHISFTQIPKY